MIIPPIYPYWLYDDDEDEDISDFSLLDCIIEGHKFAWRDFKNCCKNKFENYVEKSKKS